MTLRLFCFVVVVVNHDICVNSMILERITQERGIQMQIWGWPSGLTNRAQNLNPVKLFFTWLVLLGLDSEPSKYRGGIKLISL